MKRRGRGIGCMWYGCGNTSMSNPSTLHMGIDPDGVVTLYSGAQDIGRSVGRSVGDDTYLEQIGRIIELAAVGQL